MSEPKINCGINTLATVTISVTLTKNFIMFLMGDGRILTADVIKIIDNTVFYGFGSKSSISHKDLKTLEKLFKEQPDLILEIK